MAEMGPKMSETTFRITVTMRTRWVSHFLGMLGRMQYLGAVGSSRHVTIYSDGDGDFRPKFEWDHDLPEPAEPRVMAKNGDTLFDTG